MGFRTVIIKNRAKLEFRLNSLIVRGESEKKIYVKEINTLIVQSTAVSLTAALLSELVRNNIKVIFCDEKCNPAAELLPYYGAHNTSKRYKKQLAWAAEIKAKIRRKLICKKIDAQSKYLADRGFAEQSQMLKEYSAQVTNGDFTNREGHAAKVYFNCVLGQGNSRHSGDFVNGCLNYGYTVLLSAFNREIVASGYLTQLGIWHDNEFNSFNLSCDLIEPFRVVVDRTAFAIDEDDKEYKKKLINILNYKTSIANKHTTLDIALRQYVHSVFHALEQNDESLIIFPDEIMEYEL